MTLKSRFLDIAAHELRTPVTSFSLIVQLAQKQLAKGNPVEAYTLMRLRSQAERISRLVVDLLDVSRLERGAIKLQIELKNIVEVVSEIINDYKLLRPTRNILFVKPEETIQLQFDPVRIMQVLSNLIDNACKYTPDETDILISVTKRPEHVRVSVLDSGPGIPDLQKESLFTPFTRGSIELTGRSGGLGLGLYVSRMIIELHGGKIGVETKIDSGSIFYFDLPVTFLLEDKKV